MRTLKTESFFLSVLLLAGCASAGPVRRPAWIDSGETMQYPKAMYILGRGEAGSKGGAEDRAIRNVSKVFSVQINSVNTADTTVKYASDSSGNKSMSKDSSVRDNLSVSVNKSLEGVAVLASWQDPETSKFYVLAGLDKAMALKSFQDKIAFTDEKIKGIIKTLDESGNNVEKAAAGSRIKGLLKGREDLTDCVRVISSAADISAPYSIPDIVRKTEAALAALKIRINVSPEEYAGVISKKVSAGLNGQGLRTAGPSETSPDIIIDCRLEFGKMDVPPGDAGRMTRYEVYVTAELADTVSGKNFESLEFSDEYTMLTKNDESCKKALAEKAAGKLSDKVTEKISAYFGDK